MKEGVVMDLISPLSSPPENQGTPLRAVFCLKRNVDMTEIEKIEDCFILDFNPYDSFEIVGLQSMSKDLDDSDLSVLAEKGQVACRDYPHSRHLCLKNPFEKTPHESYCELCYCFVCDLAAPCSNWSGASGHCHAVDNEAWKLKRSLWRHEKYGTKKLKGWVNL